MNYTLRKTPDGWKAWDVVIEGISYVKSFREDFGAEIDQKGLDAVIERIEKGGDARRQARRRPDAVAFVAQPNSVGSVQVLQAAPDRLTVSGALTFETAKRAHDAGLRVVRSGDAGPLQVDCAGVTESDSAGLAVLIDWLGHRARASAGHCTFTNIPAGIRAAAQISDVDVICSPAALAYPSGAAAVCRFRLRIFERLDLRAAHRRRRLARPSPGTRGAAGKRCG